MAFTDNCDLFGSVHEDGVNLVIKHLMRQRPSLFNYGTKFIADNPFLFCQKIDVTVDVLNYGNPLLTIEAPLPIIGTNGAYGLDFIFQMSEMQIDFHPSNIFKLPPELVPLHTQGFAIKVRLCGGIGCPEQFPRDPSVPGKKDEFNRDKDKRENRDSKPNNLIVLHPKKLECFCLDLFVVGHFVVIGSSSNQYLSLELDGFEIVDIKPEPLENSIECYIKSLIKLVVLPKMSLPIKNYVFNILDLATVTLYAIPPSSAIPNNPAIQGNELKIFVGAVIS